MDSKKSYLEEEVEWIQNSGEIPEVAIYTSLYCLTEDEDGPKLKLTESDIRSLEDAVIHRYRTIILRDLNYSNRGSDGFRGVKRAIINYGRLKDYLSRKKLFVPDLKKEVRHALWAYLNRECQDILNGRAYRTLNCDQEQLEQFAAELGLNLGIENLDSCFSQVPLSFREICRVTQLSEVKDYPFKCIYDFGDHFEVVIINEDKKQFPFSLKIFCGQAQSERRRVRSKVYAIYRSIPKLPAPWAEMSSDDKT